MDSFPVRIYPGCGFCGKPQKLETKTEATKSGYMIHIETCCNAYGAYAKKRMEFHRDKIMQRWSEGGISHE